MVLLPLLIHHRIITFISNKYKSFQILSNKKLLYYDGLIMMIISFKEKGTIEIIVHLIKINNISFNLDNLDLIDISFKSRYPLD